MTGAAPLFNRVLVANRGEIAVRIMRTCREMAIATVAVYSDADPGALHVRCADRAVRLGPPPPLSSYLNIEALLHAAAESGAEAVHPGYGFLAENPVFAQAVVDAGMVWIGPPAAVIKVMGDKIAAKELALSRDVPVVPGYYGEDQSAARLLREARDVGYPLLVKAAAGGGGKGMRVVQREEEFSASLAAAKREAHSAFDDDRVFLERLITGPRHVEVQIACDQHEHAVYLGDRDCSIQRRHQKVVEESPSPAVSDALRHVMGRSAVELARACGYTNIGTVEFLVAGEEYYFLEMNTRIQVEHPVTEAVTGLDLVRLQLQVAAGQTLPFDQEQVQASGHAFEARIYAEDPSTGFLPSTGSIRRLDVPEGPGVRNDLGVTQDSQVTPFYDPMLGKLIVYGASRDQALERMRSALEEYHVTGVTTNLEFLRWLMVQREFVAGTAGTQFLDETWQSSLSESVPDDAVIAAVLSEVINAGSRACDVWKGRGSWRTAGIDRTLIYVCADERFRVRVSISGEQVRLGWNDAHASEVTVLPSDGDEVQWRVQSEIHRARVHRHPEGLAVSLPGSRFVLQPAVENYHVSGASGAASAGSLTAPMPGTILCVDVQPGQTVSRLDPLVIMEAMKMEHVVQAPFDGTVQEVLVQAGEVVPAATLLIQMQAG